jgi:hypothetical protein
MSRYVCMLIFIRTGGRMFWDSPAHGVWCVDLHSLLPTECDVWVYTASCPRSVTCGSTQPPAHGVWRVGLHSLLPTECDVWVYTASCLMGASNCSAGSNKTRGSRTWCLTRTVGFLDVRQADERVNSGTKCQQQRESSLQKVCEQLSKCWRAGFTLHFNPLIPRYDKLVPNFLHYQILNSRVSFSALSYQKNSLYVLCEKWWNSILVC